MWNGSRQRFTYILHIKGFCCNCIAIEKKSMSLYLYPIYHDRRKEWMSLNILTMQRCISLIHVFLSSYCLFRKFWEKLWQSEQLEFKTYVRNVIDDDEDDSEGDNYDDDYNYYNCDKIIMLLKQSNTKGNHYPFTLMMPELFI